MTANPLAEPKASPQSHSLILDINQHHHTPLRQIHLHRIMSELRPSSGNLACRDGFAR